jgi:hypothetical protein
VRSYSTPDHSLPGQPDALTVGYGDEEHREAAIREMTLRQHSPAISEWLFALHLFAVAFDPERDYDRGEMGDDRVSRGAFELRLQFLALAGRAAKPALDLLVAGYYTESWALLQAMLEEWARSVYIRVKPEEFVRWYEADMEPMSVEIHRREPNWGEIASIIRRFGAETDRAVFEEALLRWQLLNMGSKPSGEGITQIHDQDSRIVAYRAEYHPTLCEHTLSHGVFVQRAILGELALLGPHPQEWVEWNDKFAVVAESLIEASRPTMDEWVRSRHEERARRVGRRGSRI